MPRSDRKPFIPEGRDAQGPGVDFWRQLEANSDDRTNHETLLADGERRKRIAHRLSENSRRRAATAGEK